MSDLSRVEAQAAVAVGGGIGAALRWSFTTGWLVFSPLWLVVSIIHSVSGRFWSPGLVVWGFATVLAWAVWYIRRRRAAVREQVFYEERCGDSPVAVQPLLLDFEQRWPDTAYAVGLTTLDGRRPGVSYGELLVNGLAGDRWDRHDMTTAEALAGDAGRRAVPEIEWIMPTVTGFTCGFVMVPGQTLETWTAATEALAGVWQVPRVTADLCAPGVVQVRAMAVDPLAEPVLMHEATERGLVRERSTTAVTLGVDEYGEPVDVRLFEASLLVGGVPGSGKSGLLTALFTAVSGLREVALLGVDPKAVELASWGERFTRIVTTPEDTTDLLWEVWAEIQRRQELCARWGHKKIVISEWTPLVVLVIDEMSDVVSNGITRDEKKGDEERITLLRNILQKGRAFGVCSVLATQKPSSENIPTRLRDLCTQRVAMRTTTRAMTETIMGGAVELAPAETISGSERGIGWFGVDTRDMPVRARAFWVPDEDVPAIAQASAAFRVASISGADVRELRGPEASEEG